MAVTAKAKSAIHHLMSSLQALEKAQVHMLQAKTSLAKSDVIGRQKVDIANEALMNFVSQVQRAVDVITENNPAQPKEE